MTAHSTPPDRLLPVEQDPVYPAFTDDGVPPVVFDWPVATVGSSGAFPNVDYNLIKTQMAQFFPDTAPVGVAPGITESNTYAIGVFYMVRIAAAACTVSADALSSHAVPHSGMGLSVHVQ